MPNLTFIRKSKHEQDQDVVKRWSVDTSFTMPSEDLALPNPTMSFDRKCFNANELACLQKLSAFCYHSNRHLSNDLIIRYAVHYNFMYTKAKDAIIKGYGERYLHLQMKGELMRYFLDAMVCFPLPGLKSRKTNSDVIYIRPSRYLATDRINRQLVLDSVSYVLNDLSRKVHQCRNGIVVIVNMDGYSRKNYSYENSMKMTALLEGDVIPTRVHKVLLVNPPTVFKRLWKVLRPALSKAYKKRVHIITNDKLGKYLIDGYEEYLPDEFMGWKNAEEMVIDWTDEKRYEEQED